MIKYSVSVTADLEISGKLFIIITNDDDDDSWRLMMMMVELSPCVLIFARQVGPSEQ